MANGHGEGGVSVRPGGVVVLNLKDSLLRLVAHAVAQFYCRAHRSITVGRERVVCIQAKDFVPSPRVSFVDLLFG